jgi:hypothetical protein
MAAYQGEGANLPTRDDGERVNCGRVSASFLPILGAGLELGRGFLHEEDRPGGLPVIILSHGLWKRRYGGDTNILGRTIKLDQKPYSVVGVLTSSFRFSDPYDILIPLGISRGGSSLCRE